MTYPPGNPGYPPAQSPGSYGTPATPSSTKSEDAESNLKLYLTIAVATLGVAAYLLSFGDLYSVAGDEPKILAGFAGDGYGVVAALLAALLAGVSLLPKAKNYGAVVAAIATLGALETIETAVRKPDELQATLILWFLLAVTVIQAAIAITALLLDAGVITAPAPRPKYDQYGHYGQYGYYGQQQAPYQQSGYGTQYGGYPSGPTTGGFSAQPGPQQSSPQSQQHGSPTPPTGFPSFSPPPSSSGAGAPGQGSADHGQQAYGQGQPPQSPSGPSPS